ncbi:MAG TPA: type ISP restriction/modification enzyme [Sphingobacteriaceae bacterium]|nr:type ISP restriction/modification enzyme [Sphingobacteriaceae bacterium]
MQFLTLYIAGGLASARDAYCYNSSKDSLSNTIHEFIGFYEKQRNDFQLAKRENKDLKLEEYLDFETVKVTWNRGLKNDILRNKTITFHNQSVVKSLYRPFFKQQLYFAQELNDMVYQIPKLFPTSTEKNK